MTFVLNRIKLARPLRRLVAHASPKGKVDYVYVME